MGYILFYIHFIILHLSFSHWGWSLNFLKRYDYLLLWVKHSVSNISFGFFVPESLHFNPFYSSCSCFVVYLPWIFRHLNFPCGFQYKTFRVNAFVRDFQVVAGFSPFFTSDFGICLQPDLLNSHCFWYLEIWKLALSLRTWHSLYININKQF